MERVIVSNQARCKKCGDVIFSRHRHDYVECSCGAISVDGGRDYLKRGGSLDHVEEQSITVSASTWRAICSEVDESVKSGSNEYGVVCAVFRALRDSGHPTIFQQL